MQIRRLQQRIAIRIQLERCENSSRRNALVNPGLGIAAHKRWAEPGWQNAIHAAGDHVIPVLSLRDDALGVHKLLAVGRVDLEHLDAREPSTSDLGK